MADPDKLVHSASRNGNFETVQKLLSDYPDVDLNSTHEGGVWTALHESCDFGKLDVTRLLVEHPGIDLNIPDKEGRTGLFWASYRNRADIVDYLLRDERANINQPTGAGISPFMVVCQNSNLEIAKTYFASGRLINFEQRTTDGKTAMELISNAPLRELLTKFLVDPTTICAELRTELKREGVQLCPRCVLYFF